MYSFSCLVDFASDVSAFVRVCPLLLSRADSRVHVFVILVCACHGFTCVAHVCDYISCSLPGAVFFVTVAMLGPQCVGSTDHHRCGVS